jgi:diguanylate cyclase (GGDEF)-like protein
MQVIQAFTGSTSLKACDDLDMKRGFSDIYLNGIAGLIALGILALSAYAIWSDRQEVWQEAEQSSKNLVTAITRDLGGSIALLDTTLRSVISDLDNPELQELSPAIRHKMLFGRTLPASYMTSILILNEAGNVVADTMNVPARAANFADRDYFQAHRENGELGLYLSRPYKSRLRPDDYSVTISRRISHPDGSFAGIIMVALSLNKIGDLFQGLDLGYEGAINLFRDDGILLMRKPFLPEQIGRDMSRSPNAGRIIREGTGSFEGVSAIDNVRRLYTFGRVDRFPLILSVSLSSGDVLAAWRRKALFQGIVTAALCAAVVIGSALFRRELTKRTRAETKLRRIARTDDLTGLPNRRAFRETFEREWRQAIRSGTPISLLFVDGDFFKAFNDHYGHGAGDEVLRAIARTLEANIRRPRDTAVRYGGEEFIVLLPETGEAGARVIAENIRQAVMDIGVSHERSPYRTVTVSIGVSCARPGRDETGATLIEDADIAVYKAKEAGRNCVCTGDEFPIAAHHPIRVAAKV